MDYITPSTKTGRLWKNKADFFKPFRTAATTAENIIPLYHPDLPRQGLDIEPNLRELNSALAALVDIFPDVQHEVFREMLISVGEESRLQIVTEHLLRQKAKWVKGRYRTPAQRGLKVDVKEPSTPRVEGVSDEDRFRSEEYKASVKQVLYQEFKALGHSTIRAVLAERNFSYTLARPVLQAILARSWRTSISSFWLRRSPTVEVHPFVVTTYDGSGVPGAPAVRHTGSQELNQELYELFVASIIAKQRQEQLSADRAAAIEINEAQAKKAKALFDCECCYSTFAFEEIAACDDGCHVLCLECIRRTVNEALFGQGWSRTRNLQKATIRCFSPTADDCDGIIPPDLVQRALSQGGVDTENSWATFQSRILDDCLLQTGCSLQRCSACNYAEIDDVPAFRFKSPMAIWYHIATKSPAAVQITFLLLMAAIGAFTIPFLVLVCTAWLLINKIPAAADVLKKSRLRVQKRRRGLKFHCQNPSCRQVTCVRCMSLWHDPHICFESETTSLRTAIESSATAAIKRTCPKCMLSFVKSSGCNKLVCNCGYIMCYVCRQEITTKEGYGHFCQHFRQHGGRCDECERCDLYGDEDEEKVIRKAADEAEKMWRETEGNKEDDRVAAKLMIDAFIEQKRGESWAQIWIDVLVDALVA